MELSHAELLEKYSSLEYGFIYPDWQAIGKIVQQKNPESDWHAIYNDLATKWLSSIKDKLEGDFELSESENFLVLCDENEHTRKNIHYHCERSLKYIVDEFNGALNDSGYGKHVLIVFDNADQYYNYVSYFVADGDQPLTSGMSIGHGYIHVVLPPIAYDAVPVDAIAHELTHALLQEYIIPTWLNEAIAMRMEDAMVGHDGLILTRETYQEHVDFWNEETIQEFWSGEIWEKSSEGFELSYVLARILWKKIVEDLSATKEELVKLIRTIDVADSGNAAFKAIFDHSLGDLVEDFLGEGNWEPTKNLINTVEV